MVLLAIFGSDFRSGGTFGKDAFLSHCGLAVVSGDIGAGDRSGSGWCSGHGGPVCLFAAHRPLYRFDLGHLRFAEPVSLPNRNGRFPHNHDDYSPDGRYPPANPALAKQCDNLYPPLAVTKRNYVAENSLGLAVEAGRTVDAERHFEAAIRYNQSSLLLSNLGAAHKPGERSLKQLRYIAEI